jgi:tetratricopeptide (TPR) repeat protein
MTCSCTHGDFERSAGALRCPKRGSRAMLLAMSLLVVTAGAAAQEQPAQDEPEQEHPAQDEPAQDASADQSGAVARARAHFQKGVDYYTEGDLTAALVEFERAYELQPTYLLLYNLGQVTYEQGDYAAAERYFSSYLAQGGAAIEAARRSEVQRDLQRLRGRVADVIFRADQPNTRVFVDDHPVAHTPFVKPVRISAGKRRIRAESPGYAPFTRVVDVIGGETLTVELALGAPLEMLYRESSGASSGPGPALWTGIATGVLAAGAGGMAFWTSREDEKYADALERRTTRRELDSLEDSTETKALITDVLIGAAVVAATLTVVLLVIDGDEEENRSVAKTIEIGPGSVRGTF